MTTAELVYEHLKQLPTARLGTVLDFVEFLEQQEQQARPARASRDEVTQAPRQPGSARGQVWMAPDFDAPSENFNNIKTDDDC